MRISPDGVSSRFVEPDADGIGELRGAISDWTQSHDIGSPDWTLKHIANEIGCSRRTAERYFSDDDTRPWVVQAEIWLDLRPVEIRTPLAHRPPSWTM